MVRVPKTLKKDIKGSDRIAITSASLPAKKRILSTCVKLFLEQGYKKTTVAEIIEQAEVSCSTFQNIFRAKDGVLSELVHFMFQNQFGTATQIVGSAYPPPYVYAVETAIQMTLTELNENLRDIYLEAYTQHDTLEYIQRGTARQLHRIFGCYQPQLEEEDYYALDIGTCGLMRGYMARPCGGSFTLEAKLRAFLSASLRVYRMPEEDVERVLAFVTGLDIRAIAQKVMEGLFQELAVHYQFSLDDILPAK